MYFTLGKIVMIINFTFGMVLNVENFDGLSGSLNLMKLKNQFSHSLRSHNEIKLADLPISQYCKFLFVMVDTLAQEPGTGYCLGLWFSKINWKLVDSTTSHLQILIQWVYGGVQASELLTNTTIILMNTKSE